MAAMVLDASLFALLGVVTVSDLRTRLVPDAALVASLAIVLPVCLLSDPGGMPERLLSGLAAGGFLLVATLIRPDGMGLGDVKLAGVLGVYLGARVAEAILVSFAAGSIAGLILLARHGWSARDRTIPFAPFLAIGALIALAAQP
jgi:leader peptidase (prepilin peptidase)/N-methyltransferase